jgi:hypothetical protein
VLTNATPSSSHELESRELWPWASVLATSIGWNQAGAAPHMEELYRGSAGATARPTRKEGWRTVACLHATRREEEKKVGSARHVSLFSGRDQRSWSPRRLACRLPTTLLSCSSLLHFTHIMSSHAPSAELPWPASPLPPRFVLTLLVFSANRKRQTGRLGIGCWMRPRHRRGWRFAVRCCDGRMWVELQAQIWRMLLPLW